MNTKEQAEQLIQSACNYYKIDRLRSERKKPFRIVKNKDNQAVQVDALRMAMSYFLYKHFPLHMHEIGPMVGYSDHSTISYQYKKIDYYVQVEDAKIYPYYLVIKDLAENLGINTERERVLVTKNNIFTRVNK
mgnify:CR=1 FL=1